MKSPFEFKQYGESGRWVSSVFPHQAQEVDEMAFLMAMASKTNVHGPATYMMNSGFLMPGFPCLGAWISYGLGKLTDELPTFVVLPDPKGLPYNQKGPFSAGFLPAVNQAAVINAAAQTPIRDLFADEKFDFASPAADRDGFDLLRKLNSDHASGILTIRDSKHGSIRTNSPPACNCRHRKRLTSQEKPRRPTASTA